MSSGNVSLKERAVLMRFSAGLPGEQRQDTGITEDVKRDKNLGNRSGKWEKFLYPPEALQAIKAKQNEARQYHNAVTLPFDTGIGILPAALIKEYGDRMRQFKGEVENLVESTFLADPQKWIDWACKNHNGTFDPSNYPGCHKGVIARVGYTGDAWIVNRDEFCAAMRPKFYFRSEPLPVPDADHFCNTVASLLGTDLESVNLRVRDAALEAQRELMSRILKPVKHMATTLGKENPRIYDTLIGNVAEIVKLAPALNLADDPELAEVVKECQKLTEYNPEVLRGSPAIREDARATAQAMVDKLQGYAGLLG